MAERKRPKLVCPPGTGRTKQYLAAECDVNAIMRRVAESGQMPVARGASFQNVVGLPMDYFEAVNFVMEAQNQFWALKPDLRMRFKNDVGALLAFIANPANHDESVRLGLLPAQEKPVESVPPEQVVKSSVQEAKKEPPTA